MESSAPDRLRIFISYNHKDQKYLKELYAHLAYYERQGNVDFWDDTKIIAGSLWHREIEKAIQSAKIAILLVSPDYLASDFITKNELPPLLKRAKQEGLTILSVILKPCAFEDTPLAQFQPVNSPSKPLSSMSLRRRAAVWEKVAEIIQDALASLLSPSKTTLELSTPPALPSKTTIYVFRGHSDRVNVVRWSPNGKYIASASDDKTVQILDAVTGRRITTYRGHSGFVFALAWSPDGKYLASGGDDNTVQVIDSLTGKLLFSYLSHSKVVAALDWSPDGKYLAFESANIWPYRSEEDTVQVVEAFTGKSLFTHRSRARAAGSLSWSPDGKYLAFASYAGIVEVLDAANGSLFYTYHGSANQVNAVSWSPDGKHLISGGDDGVVQVWNTTTQIVVYSYSGHFGSVFTIAWSPDGQYIASAGEGRIVHVWNVNTGETIQTYYGHSGTVLSVAWAPKEQRIASAGQDKTIQVWQVSLLASQESKEQWLQEGIAYYQAERYEEALAAYERAIHLDPDYARSYLSKGDVLSKLQRYEEALVAYEQAIYLDPDYARSYHNKGDVLYKLQRYEEALATYKQALQLEQVLGDAAAERHELYTMGNLHADKGQLEEAERYYREASAIDRKPQNQQSNGADTPALEQPAMQRELRDETEHYL